ncbi:MAG: hypothetical protein OIN85_03095 [Candidatus Methanoperedens sp.]|nr:hypothetical protein [Candidatus Methanoperedens sp.]
MNNEITSMAPKPFIFVLMPFDEKFNDIYKYGIKGAAEDAGAYAERVDEQNFTEGILDRIFNQISKADVIVADMTGRNSNVFYEVGYAHALGKIVLLLTQNVDDIPFDLKHRPHTVYGGKIETLQKELTQRLIWAINESKKQRGKNLSESFSLSLFEKEIPEARFSREIPTIYPSQTFDINFPIFIRNDSPESSSPITHIYLITPGNSNVFPLEKSFTEINNIRRRENYMVGYENFEISYTTFDSPEGKIKLFPLNVTIPSIPSGAINSFHIFIKGNLMDGELFSIRIYTSSNSYDFPFKVSRKIIKQ